MIRRIIGLSTIKVIRVSVSVGCSNSAIGKYLECVCDFLKVLAESPNFAVLVNLKLD